MIRVKNTSMDRTKVHSHRTSPKLRMEPLVNGKRLMMGEETDLPEEGYERHKDYYDQLIAHGTIEFVGAQEEGVAAVNADGLRTDGPTMEEWVKAGYQAENYPPRGYASKPSAGLAKFQQEQIDAAVKAREEAAKKAAPPPPPPAPIAPPPAPPPSLTDAEKIMIASGKAIEAVRAVRERTNCALAVAKELVDAYQAAHPTTMVMPPVQQAELVAASAAESTPEPAGAPAAESEESDQKRGPGRPKKKLM